MRGGGLIMNDDPKQCDTCPWPLDYCTEDGAPKAKPVAVNCPREHDVWERRLSEARLSLMSGVSLRELAALEELEEDDLVGV